MEGISLILQQVNEAPRPEHECEYLRYQLEVDSSFSILILIVYCTHLCQPDRCGATQYSDIDENICKVGNVEETKKPQANPGPTKKY